MSPQLFLKIKGLVIMPVGLAFVLATSLVISLFGGEAQPLTNFFAQLFGLLLVGIGWAMFKTPAGKNPSFHDCIGNVFCDLIGVVLTVQIISVGYLGVLAYLLVATYLASALGYIYGCICAKKAGV